MRTSRVLIAAAVLLAALIPASGFAQVESTPIPAPVKPNFSSLSFMVGKLDLQVKKLAPSGRVYDRFHLLVGSDRLLDKRNVHDTEVPDVVGTDHAADLG